MSLLPSDDDPPPVPPVRPESGDCCNGGCERCVFDLYDEALERCETQLRAWQRRRDSASSGTG
jgi:hypothetical protein